MSGGDAIKTGFAAFFYSLRTVALPFVFIFNTDLLLIDVTLTQGIIVFIVASIAILVFTAGTMGWFVTRSRIYESVALILIAFVLFRPDFVMNRLQPPFTTIEPAQFTTALGNANVGDELRVVVSGPDFDTGNNKDTTLVVAIDGEGSGEERLEATGLLLIPEGDVVKMDEPSFSSPYAQTLGSFDFYLDEPVVIKSIQAPSAQSPKELVYIPAFLLLFLIGWLQSMRRKKQEPETSNENAGEVA